MFSVLKFQMGMTPKQIYIILGINFVELNKFQYPVNYFRKISMKTTGLLIFTKLGIYKQIFKLN